MTLPDPDPETTDRLLHSDDPGATGAAIMSAVAAFLIGSLGQAQAAEIMRDWADAIESRIPEQSGSA